MRWHLLDGHIAIPGSHNEKHIQEIFDIIEDIKAQGTTVLLIEQNANKALSIADRGYVLETGKVVLSGTGEELLASDEVRKAYLGG